jgi:SAM-dependent methyltransferase
MHTNSRLLFEKYALPEFKRGMRVLEIGPNKVPSTYQSLTGDLPALWHTLDMYDSPMLTYPNSQEYSFAVADSSYDIVVSGQVLEHVKKPWRWLPELARVVRPGGLVITINPVSWPYHEAPVDCWRAYPEGMKALYEDSSLEVTLSYWGSLETPQYRRAVPGVSIEQQGRIKRVLSRASGLLGLPVERSFDAITIGRKPLN